MASEVDDDAEEAKTGGWMCNVDSDRSSAVSRRRRLARPRRELELGWSSSSGEGSDAAVMLQWLGRTSGAKWTTSSVCSVVVNIDLCVVVVVVIVVVVDDDECGGVQSSCSVLRGMVMYECIIVYGNTVWSHTANMS